MNLERRASRSSRCRVSIQALGVLLLRVLCASSSPASAEQCSAWTLTANVDWQATTTNSTAKGVTIAEMTTLPCLSHYGKLLTAHAGLYTYAFGNPCTTGELLVESGGGVAYIQYNKVTAKAETEPDQRGCNTVTWRNKGSGALDGAQKQGQSECKCADCLPGGVGGGPFVP